MDAVIVFFVPAVGNGTVNVQQRGEKGDQRGWCRLAAQLAVNEVPARALPGWRETIVEDQKMVTHTCCSRRSEWSDVSQHSNRQ
jgi:hypothetical protein